jgi:excisionase family DNA binding protein
MELLNEAFRNLDKAQVPFTVHARNLHEIRALIKEIDGVKAEIDKIGSFFLSDEECRIRKALKTKLNNLLGQLDQKAKEDMKKTSWLKTLSTTLPRQQDHGDEMETHFDEVMTVSEIAAFLKVPVSWVYERTRRTGIEKIPHVKLGKYLRFSASEVKAWLLQQREFWLQFLDPINKLPADAEPAKRALKGGKLARKKHFQHGSLFKRGKKNKVWVARFREPESINGQTQFVRRSEVIGTVAELPTRRDAELILSNRLRHLNSANYHPRACCYLRDFVEEWKPQVLPTLKYSTQKDYQYVLETHLLPAFGDLRLRLISREAVQNLLLLKLKQQLSWKTVKHIRTVLGTILGTAEACGYIEDNPVRKTKLPRRGPRPERKVLAPNNFVCCLRLCQSPPARWFGW